MTARARAVLADCEHALTDFNASADTKLFMRPRWLSLITLLRAVGHVLDKIDRPGASPEVRGRMLAAWQQLSCVKRPHIFHDFIETERNDTVKQYEIGPAARPKIHGASTLKRESLYVSDLPGAVTLSPFSMRDGPYKGHDPRMLAREAIEFWRDYLDRIGI